VPEIGSVRCRPVIQRGRLAGIVERGVDLAQRPVDLDPELGNHAAPPKFSRTGWQTST
jgi:hypothetical protein